MSGTQSTIPQQIKELREHLDNADDGQVMRVIAHALLLLVDVTDQLVNEVASVSEATSKTAGCLDYLTDHLHEVGQPA